MSLDVCALLAGFWKHVVEDWQARAKDWRLFSFVCQYYVCSLEAAPTCLKILADIVEYWSRICKNIVKIVQNACHFGWTNARQFGWTFHILLKLIAHAWMSKNLFRRLWVPCNAVRNHTLVPESTTKYCGVKWNLQLFPIYREECLSGDFVFSRRLQSFLLDHEYQIGSFGAQPTCLRMRSATLKN